MAGNTRQSGYWNSILLQSGIMKRIQRFRLRAVCLMLLTLCGTRAAVAAEDVDIAAVALFRDRAMLMINGERQVLKAGETGSADVTLVSSNSKQAVVRIGDTERVIKLGNKITSHYRERGRRSISLSPGQGGHYTAGGSINGHAVDFLVDTGATHIAINQRIANRIGLRYREGERSVVATASGIVEAYSVVLDRVRLGDIEIRRVSASVLEGDFPQEILLGNAFLDHLDIIREGKIMKIIER